MQHGAKAHVVSSMASLMMSDGVFMYHDLGYPPKLHKGSRTIAEYFQNISIILKSIKILSANESRKYSSQYCDSFQNLQNELKLVSEDDDVMQRTRT